VYAYWLLGHELSGRSTSPARQIFCLSVWVPYAAWQGFETRNSPCFCTSCGPGRDLQPSLNARRDA